MLRLVMYRAKLGYPNLKLHPPERFYGTLPLDCNAAPIDPACKYEVDLIVDTIARSNKPRLKCEWACRHMFPFLESRRMRLKLRREMRFYTNTTPTSNPVIPDEILFALTEMSEDTPQDKRYNYD